APIWGLIKTAQTEHPHRITLIDLDHHPTTPHAIPHALTLNEPQLAIRNGHIHTPRIKRADDGKRLSPPKGSANWRIGTVGKGTLDAVALVDYPEASEPLAAGTVRVAVRAVGINFRDVLVALDMVPGQEGIIGEGSGVVLEVGPGVEDFSVGDRVMGMFSQGIGPVAATDRRLLSKFPDSWTFAQAASVPVAFLTAYEALVPAEPRPGERLLIHAAAGGVGLAALQLAAHWDLEAFATASPGKWPALTERGVDERHIASSRTLDFEETFRENSAGKGMDIVLNSLANEFIDASLRLLGDGGRFIEMGKTDIRDADAVTAEHPGIDYQVYDLTQTAPDRVQELYGELAPLFAEGVLAPLPVTSWDVHEAREAMRYLSKAQNIGKVILTVPRSFTSGGTVLITGGTGALGALTARHLVTHHGVTRLLLTSRRGPEAEGAEQLRTELTALGAHITLTACDAADHNALTHLINTIPTEHPLTAVIHTAGVLDDTTIETLTPQQLDTVLRPKADAAWNLHHLTQDKDLDAFILFSSMGGVLGAPGQGNYAAANTYLDALAQHRRAQGLPATSLAWGLWAEATGMTGHLTEADVTRMTRSGFPPISSKDGLAFFDAALTKSDATLLPVDINTGALAVLARDGSLPPVLSDLVRATPQLSRASTGAPAVAVGSSTFKDEFTLLSDADGRARLIELVRAATATVLAHPAPESIDVSQPFKGLGFDSLTTVQLRNHLNAATGLHLPTTLAFDHPTPAALARHLLEHLRDATDGGSRAGSSPAPVETAPPRTDDEPIAIVGIGCRYPGGVASAEDLWELVSEGRD
ncbi:SDR family NAD(P)-dependent oxidoreductase, partial [Streptomyces sp. NPDC055287]